MSRPSVLFGFVVLMGGLLSACGTSMQSLTTVPRPEALRVDGSIDEWGGALTQLKGTPLLMATSATDTTLHIALLLQGRDQIRSVARNGLIVWVDPAGGTRHTYGLRYPVGRRQQPAPAQDGSVSAPSDQSWSELAVIRNDTTRRYLPARFSSGLRADVAMSANRLVYEATIPVGNAAADSAHGLHAAVGPGASIGVETPQPDEEPNLSPTTATEGTVTPGTRRPPRGGRRGRRGRQRSSPLPEDADASTLKVWTTLRVTSE